MEERKSLSVCPTSLRSPPAAAAVEPQAESLDPVEWVTVIRAVAVRPVCRLRVARFYTGIEAAERHTAQ